MDHQKSNQLDSFQTGDASLFDLNQLDFSRHAVIEASAGTGKTYSIEQLVLRLLLEKKVTLDRILIVTFTEKATGDLKARLRKTLEAELRSERGHEADRSLLQHASDHFDQACIFTIHAFCQRILQEYPLQQGQDAHAELVKDSNLWEQGLREIQRRNWPREFGGNLRDVLELSGYRHADAAKWEKLVKHLFENAQPAHGDCTKPVRVERWPELLPPLAAALVEVLDKFAGWAQAARAGRDDYERPTEIDHIADWVAHPDSRVLPLSRFHVLIGKLDGESYEFGGEGFPMFATRNTGPEGLALLRRLEEIRQAAPWGAFGHQLALHTLDQLHAYLADFKRQRGLQTFNDMIIRVEEGLDPARNPDAERLLGELRQRFPFGIVDECQDTDPMQWAIFRRIFLDSFSSKLFVVGDPKQSIFGFRGADLPTYLAGARQMVADRGAQQVPLQVNWRSIPPLLAGLNRLFEQGAMFPPATGIQYLPVHAPETDMQRSRVQRDDTERAALNVVDWRNHDEALKRVRRRNAHFVVSEIQRLLGKGSTRRPFSFTIKEETRTLDARDICVLVFRRGEATPIIELLRKADIPFSFYKKSGLWTSEEAQHLRIVLEAVAHPDHAGKFRKALLTQFFRVTPRQLALAEEIPGQHAIRRIFERLLEQAEGRQWATFFQTLLEETGVMLIDDDVAEYERRRANLRHLCATLEHAGYAQNLDVLGLIELCERPRDPGSDKDTQPMETDRPRVTIMTVHASKGLEFPVVFLAGGFTQPQGDNDIHSYRDADGHKVFDLRGNDDAKDRAAKAQLEEDRRLLYVALTRGIFKVYVPWVHANYKGNWVGPLVHLLSPVLEHSQPHLLGSPVAELIEPTRADLKVLRSEIPAAADSESAAASLLFGEGPFVVRGPLFPRLDSDFSQRRLTMRSFTSLHRAGVLRAAEGASFAEAPSRVQDDDPVEQDDENPLRGAVFGEMVHNVLERIDFAEVLRASAAEELWQPGTSNSAILAEEIAVNLPRLQAPLPAEELEYRCRQQVAQQVWAALHTPLSELGVPLGAIAPGDRIAELEFLFPEEARRADEGFLTGFIDLLVRHRDRYYLVDWKTNLLPRYQPEDLAQAMQEADYVRQYRLYLQALARWLRRCLGPTFDFERDVGGVYYLFVRGLNGMDDSAGVFYHPPTRDDLRLDLVIA